MNNCWTPEEDAQLIELRRGGLDFREISERLGNRTPLAAKNRYRNLTMPADARRAEMDRKNAYVRAERRAVGLRRIVECATVSVPDHVAAERDARYAASLSITALICGDPPLSRSALGKKLEGAA